MGYEQYKAKKTWYNGEEFESNLEARVAEALDELGIEWEYHDRCMRGGRFPYRQYTPDFRLVDSDLLIEVAGIFDERHQNNAIVACQMLRSAHDNVRLVLVDGHGDVYCLYAEDGRLVKDRGFIQHDGECIANVFDSAGMKRW